MCPFDGESFLVVCDVLEDPWPGRDPLDVGPADPVPPVCPPEPARSARTMI